MQFSEHRSRRRVAGISLIAGPGLTLLGWSGGFVALASLPVALAGFAAIFIAQAFIGVHLLTETDEEWDHVPVFEGFHRVSTA